MVNIVPNARPAMMVIDIDIQKASCSRGITPSMIFSVDSSHVARGLVGLPMLEVSLSRSSSSQSDLAG